MQIACRSEVTWTYRAYFRYTSTITSRRQADPEAVLVGPSFHFRHRHRERLFVQLLRREIKTSVISTFGHLLRDKEPE